ncbi:hypothetical protein WJX81_004357 [Elliptochloris bilobata]|uniref:Luc7-like protein n=1 Tax=Elliptochloris bilobata TaxID=381761 RepID=A0AAW1SCR4_9CHLO
MVDATRALLDELMGRERNVPLDKRTGKSLKFSDPEVCKYALAGLCPYGLFKNTRSDLGLCKFELHAEDLQFEALQKEWEAVSERDKAKYGYERDLLELLTQLARDMDRKIVRQKERAEQDNRPRALSADDREKLDAIKAKEVVALEKSEALAEEGDVDGSQLFATQAEAFAQQHAELLKSLSAPERVMTVCEICGVFMQQLDNSDPKRKARAEEDHLQGKQYLGWKAIRDTLAAMQERMRSAPAEPLPPPPRERSRERDRERDREYDRHSHRSSRDRERDRSYRERDRGYGGSESGGRYDRGANYERERDRDYRRR